MIEIAPLLVTDFDDWRPLWRAYLTFYNSSAEDTTARMTFARLTSGEKPMEAFIARDVSSAAVGIVHWIAHPLCWTAGDYCYLQDLFVGGARRREGIGRRLIEAVYAEARSRGCSRGYWLTHETNAAAMGLYDTLADRSGFLQYVKRLA